VTVGSQQFTRGSEHRHRVHPRGSAHRQIRGERRRTDEEQCRASRVRIYALTRAGREQLQREEAQWQRAASIVERFLKISENPS
jgi:DNA-binding PadR family transcriptional regulator